MPDPKRILIIRPSALGDVCRTVPMLTSLRRAWPEADIDWIVQDDFAPAVASHPDLTRLVGFPRRRWARCWRSPRAASELLGWLGSLRRRRYDLVIDGQGLIRSGFMTWFTRAPKRIGHRDAREGAWIAYTSRVRSDPRRHTVDRMLDLVAAAGAEPVADMRLYLDQDDANWWRARRSSLSIPPCYAVLAPTSRWQSKRWPGDAWTELIDPLAERGIQRSVLVGAPGEHDQVPAFAESAAARVVDLVGETTVGQTMAVIAGAALLIANDSAPLHMAVGLDRPCIGLYGPTDPAIVGPYADRAVTIRGYEPPPGESVNYRNARLGNALMQLIRPADVIRHLDDVLGSRPAAGARSKRIASIGEEATP